MFFYTTRSGALVPKFREVRRAQIHRLQCIPAPVAGASVGMESNRFWGRMAGKVEGLL